VHHPDGTVSGWAQHVGVAPDLTVDRIGTSYVEVRSLDVNGNLSASTIVAVVIEPAAAPGAPSTPTVTGGSTGLTVAWTVPDDGASPVTGYAVRPYVGVPTGTPGAEVGATSPSKLVPAPPAGSVVRYGVTATNAVGTGPESPLSAPAIAPFGSIEAFVRQQYRDFVGIEVAAGQVNVESAEIASGLLTPASFIDQRRASEWFDGAYGPSIRLYRAYFLRNPDPSGLDFWANRRRRGVTLSSISQQFASSSEFQRRYGSLTNAQFIDQIYRNVFDREPDPSGRDFYLRRLNDRTWTRGQVVLQFSESSEHQRDMRPTVTVIELARGMNGRAPSAALVDSLLATYADDGTDGVLAALIATATYRDRVT
jgi:hypothetical protein